MPCCKMQPMHTVLKKLELTAVMQTALGSRFYIEDIKAHTVHSSQFRERI